MTLKPFRGPNVRLRPFESGDAPDLVAYLNRAELSGRRYVPWRFPSEMPLSVSQGEEIVAHWREEKRAFRLVIARHDADTAIGHANAEWDWDPHCPSVSVVVDSTHWRKGFGSEALDLLLGYLFQRTVAHNVSGWFAAWNVSARAFAKRHGFTEIGGMRRTGIRDGVYYDDVAVDILRPEWLARKGT